MAGVFSPISVQTRKPSRLARGVGYGISALAIHLHSSIAVLSLDDNYSTKICYLSTPWMNQTGVEGEGASTCPALSLPTAARAGSSSPPSVQFATPRGKSPLLSGPESSDEPPRVSRRRTIARFFRVGTGLSSCEITVYVIKSLWGPPATHVLEASYFTWKKNKSGLRGCSRGSSSLWLERPYLTDIERSLLQ